MDEFKRLPWPVWDAGTDLQQTYTLNMPDFQQNNPTDVFFCNLMQIDPLHLQNLHQSPNNLAETEEIIRHTDPRTGVEIPSHECNYKQVDLMKRNIFLTSYIQVSKLHKNEHLACLNALGCLSKPVSELSIEEKNDLLVFTSTATVRSEEKEAFLEKLREHYFAEVAKRFHDVPPSIEYFVIQQWKKQLITMYQKFANVRFSMKTGISLQLSESIMKMEAIHQEHLGNVPEMSTNTLDYLRQSFPNLMNAYNKRKITHLSPAVKGKVIELVHQHAIDFVLPMSILKRILGTETGWSFCMTVKDSVLSSAFNPKKEIVFEKPLPLAYLSGNNRYKKAAKYLMHSCFNANAFHVFNHNKKSESKTPTLLCIDSTTECDSKSNTEIEYKVSDCDEFIKNHSRVEVSYENMTFTVFDVNGYNGADDINEIFKILVPAKQASYKKENNGEIKFVNWSPKIEYQAEYGAETMKKGELISEWCELYFRPNTSTERVRFDSITGKVIHRQSITLTEVEKELKTNYGIETQQLVQRLWHALQTFNDFPVGEYLLESDSKHKDFIKIYEKTENSTTSVGISDIVKNVNFGKNLLDKVIWRPIDDSIVTEIHAKYKILPCAFPHSDYMSQNNLTSAQGTQKNQTKNPRIRENLNICPQDDSHAIIKRYTTRKIEKEQRSTMWQKSRLNAKKKRNRDKRKAAKAAKKAEVDGLKTAMQLVDQYVSPSGDSQNAGTSTMATEPTAERSKCTDSLEKEHPTMQFVRRSNRVPIKKQID